MGGSTLGWGATGHHLTCLHGHRIYVAYPNRSSALVWALKRHRIRLLNIHQLRRGINDGADVVLHQREVAVVIAAYQHGFHVLVNHILPLVGILRKQREASSTVHMSIFRHPDFSPKFRGAEEFAVEMGTAIGPNTTARVFDENGNLLWEAVPQSPPSRRVRLKPTSVVRCYCKAVFQDTVPAEMVSSLKPTQRIVEGDPMRRYATQMAKISYNSRMAFLPYGTFPIPATELGPYGLWDHATLSQDGGYRPRMLLLIRNKTRQLGDAKEVERVARRIGFHVHVMAPESVPIALQARAARYTDVLVGVHGQALTWMFLVDGTIAKHCRAVVELRFYGRKLRGMNNVFESMASDSWLSYERIKPTSVEFFNCTSPAICAAWAKTMKKAANPQIHVNAFNLQRVNFTTGGGGGGGPAVLSRKLAVLYERLRQCVPNRKSVSLMPSDITGSEFATLYK
jgi:hypothetical protein